MLFWFSIIITICLYYIKSDIEYDRLLIFILVLMFSRLYWEYSSNTLRSFSSAIFLLPAIAIASQRKVLTLLLFLLALLIHAKSTLLIVLIFYLAKNCSKCFCKRWFNGKYVATFALLVFTFKAVSGSVEIFNIPDLIDFIRYLNFLFKDDFHANKISSDFTLSFTLYSQYVIYVILPLISINSKILKDSDVDFYNAACISTLIFSLLYPEFFLIERFGQFLLLSNLYLFSKYFERVWLYYMTVMLLGIMNLVTITLLMLDSDLL